VKDVQAPDSLLIAIPTYNEIENIGAVLSTLTALYPSAHVLVVDDNSPDGTGDAVSAIAAGNARVHLLRRDAKRGIGSVYRAAFGWAVARNYALVVVMDADGSHDPAQVSLLVDTVANADVAVGSRYVPGGRVENWPLRRLCLSAGANVLARLMVGRQVRDWTSGFKCYRREVLATLRFEDIASEGYAFQVEILFHSQRAGFRLREVPITFVDRRLGRTKMSRHEIRQAATTLCRIAWQRLRGARSRPSGSSGRTPGARVA
jgi:dolichol-phosphate mannosyltransferase